MGELFPSLVTRLGLSSCAEPSVLYITGGGGGGDLDNTAVHGDATFMQIGFISTNSMILCFPWIKRRFRDERIRLLLHFAFAIVYFSFLASSFSFASPLLRSACLLAFVG